MPYLHFVLIKSLETMIKHTHDPHRFQMWKINTHICVFSDLITEHVKHIVDMLAQGWTNAVHYDESWGRGSEIMSL